MVAFSSLAAFALIALGMVCSPGPNMIYLISRSITQGRLAGFISLLGVIMGFVFYMLCAAFGITALLMTVPFAYQAIQWAGAAYLLYLAWQAIKPGAANMLQPRTDLAIDGPRKLFLMGFLTNLLNPKIAVLYLSLLPQFIDPERGNVLLQSVTLGTAQIAVSFTVNLMIVFAAGGVAKWFATRPTWLAAQRWIMASVLASLAVKLVLEKRAA